MENDVESYYMDIQQQVDEIYPSYITDFRKSEERERLNEALRLSKIFCQWNPEYFELSLCIKSLVQRWDKDFKKKHLKQRHSFAIANRSALSHIYDLRENEGITALLYDYDSDSDNRIIVIAINANLSIGQNLCGILHEVGHYIGCRQRNKDNQIDRIQYFIELSLQAFLREIFFGACSQLLNQPIRDYSVLNNPAYSCEKQRIMLDIITCLSDNNLYHWIYQQLAERVTQIRNDNNNQLLCEYRRKIRDAINKAFQGIFDELGEELRNRLIAVAKTYPLHPDTRGLMMKSLDHVSCSKNWKFIDDAGKLLEEVAADVFMVRALDVRNGYLDCMLSSFNDQYANSKATNINKLLTSTMERTRLSCVQAACMNRWPVPIYLIWLESVLARISKHRALFCNKKEYYQAKKEFISISKKQNEILRFIPQVDYISYKGTKCVYSLRGYRITDCVQISHDDKNSINHVNRLRILNPGVTLGEYVRAIMNDSRYDSFFQKKENSDAVECLKTFRFRRL